MLNIEERISPLIETQFPSFYREEGKRFVAFVKAYYEWLEENNYVVNGENVAPGTLYHARKLLDIGDVDRTPDEFLSHFKEKYLNGITLEANADIRNLIKHSLELYRSKGSQRSVELLFSLLYGEEVEIYLPGEDILKASSGEWYIPIYLELEPNDLSKSYIGKQIFGASSGATALVEGIARRNIFGKVIDVLYLSSVSGNFSVGELISDETITTQNPKIIGSLTDIVLNASGRNFNVGDIVDVISEISGTRGKARITKTGSATGRINYELIDGGTGYSNTADVIISEKVLSFTTFNSSNTFTRSFIQQEKVFQPLANIEIQSPQGNLLNPNNLIFGVNSTPAIVAAGYVYRGDTTSNTKYLSISVHDVSNVVITSITNASNTGSFIVNEPIFQFNPTLSSNTLVGTVVSANATTVLIDITVGSINSTLRLRGSQSNCSANVSSFVLINGSFANADNIVTASNSAIGNCVIDTVTDETATGFVVGSNTNSLGVYNIQNNFRVTDAFQHSYIKNSTKTKTANIFFVSSGNPGGFSVGSITDTEQVFINTDFIGGNNVNDVPYLSVRVDASNSGIGFIDSIVVISGGTGYSNNDVVVFTGGTPTVNAVGVVNTYSNGSIERITVTVPGSGYNSTPAISVSSVGGVGANLQVNADFGYGFPKLPDGDLTTIIGLVLTRETKTIGTIASLSSINPGSNNNASPFNLVIEPAIAGFGRKNFTLQLNNVTKPFAVGESVTQTYTEPAVTLEVSNAGAFNILEIVEQTRSDGNVVFGEIINILVSSNTGTLYVKVANTSNTFNTSNNILGLETFATANVTNAIANNLISVARGTVLNVSPLVSNNITLDVKRTRFGTSFNRQLSVAGSSSGAQGNVVLITEIGNSPVMGNNAVVISEAGSANGTIEGVEIVDSGFAYRENELVVLRANNNPFVASGFVRNQKQGVGEGFWTSTKGFLDSNKYIIDSNYYQEYSFEIQTGLTLEKYADVLKQLIQVAGTKLFGTVKKTSNADLTLNAVHSSITVE